MQLSDRSDTGDSVNPESTATAKQHVPLEPGTQTMATELRNQEPTEVEHCDPVPAAQVTLKVPQVHTGESRLGREPDLEQMERHVVLSAYGSHRACSHIILWDSQLSTV